MLVRSDDRFVRTKESTSFTPYRTPDPGVINLTAYSRCLLAHPIPALHAKIVF